MDTPLSTISRFVFSSGNLWGGAGGWGRGRARKGEGGRSEGIEGRRVRERGDIARSVIMKLKVL